jgi:hypothetical protein
MHPGAWALTIPDQPALVTGLLKSRYAEEVAR